MAGYNAMVPKICPDLPAAQKDALALANKSAIIYTSVLLRDWRAVHRLGIGYVAAPGGYYGMAMLDFPVSMGGYSCAQNPGQPIVMHMERFCKGGDHNARFREQILAGRRELYATPFATIERETRRQLAGILAGGGFDPAADIAAITVNRWGHGYAYPAYHPLDSQSEDGYQPIVVARQRHGRIAIANSDAAGEAYLSAAIEQAHRAVTELEQI